MEPFLLDFSTEVSESDASGDGDVMLAAVSAGTLGAA